MDQRDANNMNGPSGAMDRREAVQSNDKKMKQDFPGYPHNPASEETIKGSSDKRTTLSNESDTTATGTESIRAERPTKADNGVNSEEKETKTASDRGLNVHEVDPNDPEKK